MEASVLIREPEFVESELDVCTRLFDEIVTRHDECAGTGVTAGEVSFVDCDCRLVYDYARALVYSGIPRRMWKVKLAAKKDAGVFNRGARFIAFTGQGRTSELCAWARGALLVGKRVMYCTAESLIEWRRQEMFRDVTPIRTDRFQAADAVFVDDLDRVSKASVKMIDLALTMIKAVRDGGAFVMIGDSSQVMTGYDAVYTEATFYHDVADQDDRLLCDSVMGEAREYAGRK